MKRHQLMMTSMAKGLQLMVTWVGLSILLFVNIPLPTELRSA
nr:MAG TPA: hypothetical protein [Caudoviricetes sp.]